MELYKRYVDVITLMRIDGSLQPLYMIWNTTCYKIDKVISISHTHSLVGGSGICYEIKICGVKRRLFYERNRWFLESHKP